MPIVQDELGGCLRSWRERLTPAEAGLPTGRQRRTPGLRREELAGLAGVSLDYLARLEQGRAQRPSPSVLASLARALRLTGEERSHLFRLAGAVEPGPGTLDCDALSVLGSDLQVIVYTATTGSADAEALALLATIGLQSFPD